MVEEVQAWRDAAGQLHSTRLDAAKADAVEELSKLQIFNHASALAIVKEAKTVVAVLQQVLWAEEEAAVSKDRTDA